MKTKILNALKTAYPNSGLSEKALDGVASFLVKTITDENDIATAVAGDDVKSLITSFQSATDTLRTARVKAEKDLEEYKKAHPVDDNPPAPTSVPSGDDRIAELLEKMNAMQSRLDAQDKAKSKADTIAAVRENLKKDNRAFEGLLNIVLGNAEVGEGDTVESLTEKYKGAYDAQYKVLYGDGAVPPAGAEITSGGYKPGQFSVIKEQLKKEGY